MGDKLVYTIKTVTLKNADLTKEVPVIDFDDSQKAILAEFLMSDSALLAEEINQAIKEISEGKRREAEWTGNRCTLTMNDSTAVIKDSLAGTYKNTATYPSCEIDVTQLQQLMDMWLEVKKKYSS